jgi:hypothetical protein
MEVIKSQVPGKVAIASNPTYQNNLLGIQLHPLNGLQ